MLSATDLFILNSLKAEVQSHGLKSGETILEAESMKNNNQHEPKQVIIDFLVRNNIKLSPTDYNVTEINSEQAIQLMKYGLSTKANYTHIDTEFSKSDQNKIVQSFISLFNMPKYYTIDVKLYRENLDLSDFWECGGAILIDKEKIGILWTNDLYNKWA